MSVISYTVESLEPGPDGGVWFSVCAKSSFSLRVFRELRVKLRCYLIWRVPAMGSRHGISERAKSPCSRIDKIMFSARTDRGDIGSRRTDSQSLGNKEGFPTRPRTKRSIERLRRNKRFSEISDLPHYDGSCLQTYPCRLHVTLGPQYHPVKFPRDRPRYD